MAASNDLPQIGIICDTVPYPTRSGDNQRIAELIGVLRERRCYVHLVLCGFVDSRLRKICRSHVDALHVYSGRGLKTRLRNAARYTVRLADRAGAVLGIPPLEEIAKRVLGHSMTPFIIDYWQRYPKGLDDFVAELSRRFQWKAVIVEYIWLHQAIDKLNGSVLTLLDTHDVQHKRVEEFASRAMTFPLSITRETESRIFSRFKAVIAIQTAETAVIRDMCPQLRILTVGSSGGPRNGGATSFPVAGRILYVGGYNGANFDGLERFLNSIWPKIRENSPEAELYVCGHVYRAFLGRRFSNVVFLGHKENIEKEYAEATVVINPAWIGTGLKIKTVEALARGKALVTTPKGIEGLPDDVEQSSRVTDDDDKFATEVIRLLTDHGWRERLCASAATFAINRLNKPAVYRELFDYLDEHK